MIEDKDGVSLSKELSIRCYLQFSHSNLDTSSLAYISRPTHVYHHKTRRIVVVMHTLRANYIGLYRVIILVMPEHAWAPLKI